MKKRFLICWLLIMILVIFSGCTSSGTENTGSGGGILNWFMEQFTPMFWDSVSGITSEMPYVIRWLAAIISYALGAVLYLIIGVVVLAIALIVGIIRGILSFVWSLVLGIFS